MHSLTRRVFLGLMLPILMMGLPSLSAHAISGSFDLDFGFNGIVYTDVDLVFDDGIGTSQARALAIHPPGDPNAGRIVAAGWTLDNNRLAIARYLEDGSLDNSFGTNGVIVQDSLNASWNAVKIYPQNDPNAGKIIVAGYENFASFFVARYCANGLLDDGVNCGSPGFGTGGFFTTDFGGGNAAQARDLAVQRDGKVVVAGYSNANNPIGFALLRLNSDGTLDESFNASGPMPGIVITNITNITDQAFAVAIYPEGDPNQDKIVAGGFADNATNLEFALVRYCPDGSLDAGNCGGTSFNGTGIVNFSYLTNNDETFTSLAITSEGKLIAGGFSDEHFILASFCGDGILDDGLQCGAPGFGDEGVVLGRFFETSASSSVQGMVLQPDGKILATGPYDSPPWGSRFRFVLARFTNEGALDTDFGFGGYVIGNELTSPQDIALQEDGKIVVADAMAENAGIYRIARFEGDNADLALSKSVDVGESTVGGTLIYTLTATNQSQTTATNVVITDPLPNTLTLVSAEGCAGDTFLTCNVGTLEGGASSAPITITVTASSAGVVANTASVQGAVTDSNPDNNSATALVSIVNASGGTNGDGDGCSLGKGTNSGSKIWGTMLLVAAALSLLVVRNKSERS